MWRPRWTRCAEVLVCLALFAMCQFGCGRPQSVEPVEAEVAQVDLDSIRPKVVAFCGDCHATPPPETFPRSAWYDEVQQGYGFYWDSGRTDLKAPPIDEVVSFFRSQAPEELTLPTVAADEQPTPVAFDTSSLVFPLKSSFPGVSDIRWRSSADGASALYFCDMATGNVHSLGFADDDAHSPARATLLGKTQHPAHIEPCDLDGDGDIDFLVAELGSFLPQDHDQGKVVWMRRSSSSPTYEALVLAEGLGRVADARSADFDGDGDLDIVVAEFGWRNSGKIRLLNQIGKEDGVPRFEMRDVDPRHGSIHTEIADLNQDSRPDFVALISQEHEVVVAFLNAGGGEFETQTIFAAEDPSFGSSGIQLVDLDGDGDTDVLYTNGDTLDSQHLKSSHAVRWLENPGTFPFVSHTLTHMPGAMHAVAADVDNDDDLDVVATAFVPKYLRGQLERGYDSLIWLEQTEDRGFVRHRLEQAEPGHMTLEVGDFNHDGAIDIVAGNFVKQRQLNAQWLTFWWGRKTE